MSLVVTRKIIKMECKKNNNQQVNDKQFTLVFSVVLSLRRPTADSLSGPSCSSHVCNSMETLPEASASALPRKQGSGRRGSIKSRSSLGERAAMGRRASKENALRAQLQVSKRLISDI